MGIEIIDVVDDNDGGNKKVNVSRNGNNESNNQGNDVNNKGKGRWSDGWWRDKRDNVSNIGRDVEEVIYRERKIKNSVNEKDLINGIKKGNEIGIEKEINDEKYNLK